MTHPLIHGNGIAGLFHLHSGSEVLLPVALPSQDLPLPCAPPVLLRSVSLPFCACGDRLGPAGAVGAVGRLGTPESVIALAGFGSMNLTAEDTFSDMVGCKSIMQSA